MSLRISACLLAVLSPIMLPAADDGSDEFPISRATQRRAHWGQGVLVFGSTLDGAITPIGTIDLLAPFLQQQLPAGQFEVSSHPLPWLRLWQPTDGGVGDANVVFDRSHEFPFSPRRLHQLKYDAPNSGATVLFDEFPNSGFLFRLGNTVTSDTLLPVIIPASATQADAVHMIQQAAGVACDSRCADNCTDDCVRCTAADECPIEVEFAEVDDPSEAPRPLAQTPEPPPGLPCTDLDCLFDFAQAIAAHPVIVKPAGASSETCSQAEPPLKAKVEHLLEAARHLDGAGYEDEAKLFRVEAEAIQRASTRLLTEKRQELERLQREIAELESLTGQYTMIQLKCRILEVTLPEGCTADPRLATLTTAGYCIIANRPRADACESAASCHCGDTVADLLGVLHNSACVSVKSIAEPTLITTNGHTAQLHSGGEFPVLIPVSGTQAASAGGQARIEWKDFGVRLQAVPFVLGNGKLRLSLDADVSERDFSNPVNFAGSVIPGLTTRRSRTDVETHFGDTVVVRCCGSTTKDGEKTLLMLVTPQLIAPLPEPQPNPHSSGPTAGQWTR